ncbi:MAG TPA: ATP-binding cassette domain-containing protein [Nitrososphaerales archaeon]|nr:ATP-binding cassette domain-containing protein [Nitrososphaerales archaeon]
MGRQERVLRGKLKYDNLGLQGPQMEDIIAVGHLVVVYQDGTRAVEDISFNVKDGEFFGFLGPNGAGKSTTIKTLTTLLRKTSGSVRVAGLDIDKSPTEIRKSIGVLNQETSLDVDLTGRQNLRLQGRLQQLHGQTLDGRVEELLKLVQLDEVADKPAGRYSGGMRKRLDLASALVHSPRLLFLDEPTTGLDAQSRTAIWEYLEDLNKSHGITIFLTTQYLEEADRLCHQLAIIDHGKLIAGGSPSELKKAVGEDTISLTLDPSLRRRAGEVLKTVQGVSSVLESDGGVTAHAENAGQIVPDVITALDRNGIRPSFLSISSPTLDDVFLRATGRRIRSDDLQRKETDPFLM